MSFWNYYWGLLIVPLQWQQNLQAYNFTLCAVISTPITAIWSQFKTIVLSCISFYEPNKLYCVKTVYKYYMGTQAMNSVYNTWIVEEWKVFLKPILESTFMTVCFRFLRHKKVSFHIKKKIVQLGSFLISKITKNLYKYCKLY